MLSLELRYQMTFNELNLTCLNTKAEIINSEIRDEFVFSTKLVFCFFVKFGFFQLAELIIIIIGVFTPPTHSKHLR